LQTVPGDDERFSLATHDLTEMFDLATKRILARRNRAEFAREIALCR
jgi:hypothetical protein